MLKDLVRKFLWIILGFWLCGFVTIANAGTYPLTDGTSVSGDVIAFNDDGVIFHTPDDKYTDRIPWTKFSQDALKALANDPKLNSNKEQKIRDYAEPFIETPPRAPAEVNIVVHNVTRLALPPKQSVIGALFSSSLGLLVILLIYAANIYAGFEVAVFRARPPALVAGLSAVVPIVAPIIFLSMPTYMPQGATEEDMQMATGAPPDAVAPAAAAPEAQPAAEESLHLAAAATVGTAAKELPETQVFQRGQFTFNRRFFETKFSGFFGMVRTGSNKDMVLVIKTPKGQHVAERITRISANEAYFEAVNGSARHEVMVAFGEIQEVQLKHKDA